METKLTMPRSVQTENTKQKIYEAAVNILKKKGYAYLTVSNICSAAGISNGTFFYHFKTKDELLIFYTYRGFAEFRQNNGFDAKVEGLPFDGKIIAFYCCWADYMEEMGIDFFSNFYSTKNILWTFGAGISGSRCMFGTILARCFSKRRMRAGSSPICL